MAFQYARPRRLQRVGVRGVGVDPGDNHGPCASRALHAVESFDTRWTDCPVDRIQVHQGELAGIPLNPIHMTWTSKPSLRVAVVHNAPTACNRATADFLATHAPRLPTPHRRARAARGSARGARGVNGRPTRAPSCLRLHVRPMLVKDAFAQDVRYNISRRLNRP
jgi:hypothetical protein